MRARGRQPVPSERVEERPAPAVADGRPDVWDAVRELPPKQRAAVTLRFTLDLRYAELGSVIGCSEDAARRNVHEGLRKLKEVVPR